MTTNTRTRVLARLISALLGTAAVAVGGTMLAAPSNAAGSYGPYRTVASPSLSERSAPLSGAAAIADACPSRVIGKVCVPGSA
jgi:hypothetical protein